jgi:hypothetical protein
MIGMTVNDHIPMIVVGGREHCRDRVRREHPTVKL